MNAAPHDDTCPHFSVLGIDEICDRFEDSLKRGERPKIEDSLVGCPDSARTSLLRELIKLECHYQREDFRKRFPDLDPAVLRALSAPVDEPPSTGGDRYTLVAFHAKGGMGRVSIYYDGEMHRRIAVKELHDDHASNMEVLKRFLQEARVTGRLDHPNIVPVYDLVKPTPDRTPFYTMRFVKGRTLSEATGLYHGKRLGGHAVALDLLTLLNAFVSVCQTVAYAHTQGVVHRDLKGGNVVLGDFGEVIVLDWGLAKLLDAAGGSEECFGQIPDGAPPEHTLQGVVKGTPSFLAPEQAAGRNDLVGPQTDVYGLGAILYEILSGRPPFSGSSIAAILELIGNSDPEPPTALVPGVPTALESVCLRAMAKSPSDRHSSAGELADEVQRWLAEAAERSRAHQERERFFNLSIDVLCTIGSDGVFQQSNPSWEKTLGWNRAELMATGYLDFVHPDDREAMGKEVDAIAGGATQAAFENRFRHKDGGYRWMSWTATPIRVEKLVYAVGRDVTARKDAETALLRSQERFDLAVRGSGDGLWDWDRETGESYYSPRWKSMIGYEDTEIAHDITEWETRLHPEDRAAALAAIRSCTEGAATTYEVEYRFRHKDGSYRWILDRGLAVRSDAGVSRMAGSHTDITVQKRLEQQLREGERRHQSALAEMTAEFARYRVEGEGLK